MGQARLPERRPFRWHLRIATDVTDAIAQRPEAEKREIFDLIQSLLRNPRARELRVLPIKGVDARNLHTVPVGDPIFAVLTFQILADHPAVHFFDIVFFA